MRQFLKFIFGMELYMFRTVSLPSSGVQHCTHRNGIWHTGLLTACQRDHDVYTYCCMYSARLPMMDRGTVRYMLSSIQKINEKLVHLVGFIIRIAATCFLPLIEDRNSAERSPSKLTAKYKKCRNVHLSVLIRFVNQLKSNFNILLTVHLNIFFY